MMHHQLRTFHLDFKNLVTQQPDKIALLDDTGTILTYREYLHQIEQASAWLNSLGMQPGEKIVAVMPNAIETAIIFFAALFSGYVYAPLPCTSTIIEVKRWCAVIGAGCCLLADSLSSFFKEQMLEVQCRLEVIELGGEIPPWKDEVRGHFFCGQGRVLVASSGSTGEPKAILLDADRLWSSANAFLVYHGISDLEMRFWNYLPMSYLGGLFNLLLIPLAAGGSVYIDEVFSGRTFLTFWATVKRFEINGLWLVPTILRGLLALSDQIRQSSIYPKIDYCFLGTAPVSLQEKQRFLQVFGIQALENYGLSETTFISSERLDTLAFSEEGSVGQVMPDVSLKLKPVADDNLLSQIWLRTPYMMLGYLDNQDLYAPSLDADGYWYTGDFGQLSKGNLKLLGRDRDIIKKGGLMIVLREIEALVETYSGVVEAVAVKIEHPFYGESYELYIRTLDIVMDSKAFISELNTWLCEQLVRHKWPEHVFHVSTFPRTASGKIQKHLLLTTRVSHA